MRDEKHLGQVHITKTCNSCGQTKPLEAFTRRHSGRDQRLPNCRECRAKRRREYRAAKRTRTLHEFGNAIRYQRESNSLSLLVGRMIARFGGLTAFANLWAEHFFASPAGSKQRGNVLLGILQLAHAVEPRRKSFNEMTVDEQIEFDSERHPAEM